jgi:aspartokinase-like uncharacterized kinase
MKNGRFVVVKVGGSLLDMPDFSERLQTYLQRHSGSRLLLLIGGGGAADWVRLMDRTHHLGNEISHDLALRSLDLTAHLVAALLPRSVVIEDVSDCDDLWARNQIPILSPRLFLQADDLLPDPLPHTWDVTSDSIAARVAVRMGAEELVLLKSVTVRSSDDLGAMTKESVVDPNFTLDARRLPCISVRNLREENRGIDVPCY